MTNFGGGITVLVEGISGQEAELLEELQRTLETTVQVERDKGNLHEVLQYLIEWSPQIYHGLQATSIALTIAQKLIDIAGKYPAARLKLAQRGEPVLIKTASAEELKRIIEPEIRRSGAL